MLFQKKLDRVFPTETRDETPEALEKGDGLALFLSACLVFVPVILLTLGLLTFFCFLFFS